MAQDTINAEMSREFGAAATFTQPLPKGLNTNQIWQLTNAMAGGMTWGQASALLNGIVDPTALAGWQAQITASSQVSGGQFPKD